MTAADPIPTIREQDATGETAALFADLRATLGVPFVNLIWRHLATLPGMLDWTWSIVKPLHRTSALTQAAATLRRDVKRPAGIQQPAAVFDAASVDAADRLVIGAMIRHYNAANAVNLLSLLVVQAVLDGQQPGGGTATPAAASTRESPPALPRLLGLAELPPPVAQLVLALDRFGRLEQSEAVASLYRHLAHWPGFLSITHAALSIPHATGALRDAHERTRAQAREVMQQRLLPRATAPGDPPGAGRVDAHRAIASFTDQMIARMVAMGEIMAALLPEADAEMPQNPIS